MTLKDTYRNIIVDRIERRTGIGLEQLGIPVAQWTRISRLSQALQEAAIVEQFARIEDKGRGRLSSKFRPSRTAELRDTFSQLENIKKIIWEKCESVAGDIMAEHEGGMIQREKIPPGVTAEIMICPNCRSRMTVLTYDNYKCTGCGMGYSARDYLAHLEKCVRGI